MVWRELRQVRRIAVSGRFQGQSRGEVESSDFLRTQSGRMTRGAPRERSSRIFVDLARQKGLWGGGGRISGILFGIWRTPNRIIRTRWTACMAFPLDA